MHSFHSLRNRLLKYIRSSLHAHSSTQRSLTNPIPKGIPLSNANLCAYYYEGIGGFDVVTLNAVGLATAAKWHRKEVVCDGDNVDFYVSSLNPNRPMLDSLKSDGTIAQLTSIVANVPKSWGKPDKAATESKIAYYYKGHHIIRGATLDQGALTVGWVSN